MGRTVQVRVGGQNYKVVTSATDDELQRAALVVEQKLAEVSPPGRMANPHALLLAALQLANELEEVQAKHAELRTQTRSAFTRLRDRIDATLGTTEAHDDDENPR
jgi:cell division protein ZapA